MSILQYIISVSPANNLSHTGEQVIVIGEFRVSLQYQQMSHSECSASADVFKFRHERRKRGATESTRPESADLLHNSTNRQKATSALLHVPEKRLKGLALILIPTGQLNYRQNRLFLPTRTIKPNKASQQTNNLCQIMTDIKLKLLCIRIKKRRVFVYIHFIFPHPQTLQICNPKHIISEMNRNKKQTRRGLHQIDIELHY